MAIPQTSPILHHLRQAVLRRDGAGFSDGQLLRSFLYRRDEAAFEALVRRHGPMVRGVCRRVLRNLDDADDAFQAVFLVLLNKASTLAMREVIGDWLHGVAYRTALKARTAAARRRRKEKQALRQEAIFDSEDRAEWLPLLDEEIERLPAKYRQPVVLCDLGGRTRKDAAQQLGWPEGTLSGRLSRARVLLARRLTRRGVTLSVAAVIARMASEASARLPFALVGSTCKAAMGFAAGSAGSVPAPIAALTEGVVKTMFLAKLKNVVALATVAFALTAGAGVWRYVAVAEQSEERPEKTPVRTAPKAAAGQTPNILPHPIASAASEGAASQTSEDNPPQPAPPAAAPPADREFILDVQLLELKKGERKLLAHPIIKTVGGAQAGFALGDSQKIQLGSGKTEEVNTGPGINVVIYPGKGDNIILDATVSRPLATVFRAEILLETRVSRRIIGTTLGSRCQFTVGDNEETTPWVVTISVLEVKHETGEKSIAKAEKLLKMAEFWRRKGYPGSAILYYEQLSQDFPDTIYAERAKERTIEMEKQLLMRTDLSETDRFVKKRLTESKRHREKPSKEPAKRKGKPPARIGQIFLIGNEKIADEVILEQVKLFPGQLLDYPDLDAVERKLSRIKGLKSNPKVTVIDRDGDSEFKDIQITVEEK